MNDQAGEFKFTIGGPVQVNSGTYLSRLADEHLAEACKTSEFAYVLASPQTGKSSLMLETANKLSQEGIRTAIVDLTRIGEHIVDVDNWYFNLMDELASKLKLEVDIECWCKKRTQLNSFRRFQQFLYNVVLKTFSERIVIFVDEIDITLSFDFTDDFFAVINAIYKDRAEYEDCRRLTFVLLGVATPGELIQDTKRSPFSIGRAIALDDFTKEVWHPLSVAIETKYPQQGANYFEEIYGWCGGHPYLMQKLCYTLLNWAKEHPPKFDDLVTEISLDDHIRSIENKVRVDRDIQQMSSIYRRIRDGKELVPDDKKSQAIKKLKLYGLVMARDGQLKIRNELYAKIFDSLRLLPREERYTLAIVAIMTGRSGKPKGTGFLVSFAKKTYVITCAHVIHGKTEGEVITLQHFHSQILEAKVCFVPVFSHEETPMQPYELSAQNDIAILELTQLPPSKFSELKPFSLADFQDHQSGIGCWCFGYVEQRTPKGGFIKDLICKDQVSGNFVRLSQPGRSKIERGASGAPLSDNQGRIIGMIHAYAADQEYGNQDAYFIPSRIICSTLSSLKRAPIS